MAAIDGSYDWEHPVEQEYLMQRSISFEFAWGASHKYENGNKMCKESLVYDRKDDVTGINWFTGMAMDNPNEKNILLIRDVDGFE